MRPNKWNTQNETEFKSNAIMCANNARLSAYQMCNKNIGSVLLIIFFGCGFHVAKPLLACMYQIHMLTICSRSQNHLLPILCVLCCWVDVEF